MRSQFQRSDKDGCRHLLIRIIDIFINNLFCLFSGIRFSYLEMRTVLAMLINKFKITSMNKPEEIKYFAHILLRSQAGIQVKLERRDEITKAI